VQFLFIYLFILLVDVYCFTALFGPLMCHGCRKAEEDEKYNSNAKFNEDNHIIFRQARQQHQFNVDRKLKDFSDSNEIVNDY